MTRNEYSQRECGFTLIELLVVGGVVSILAAAAMPAYRFPLTKAYMSEAKASLAMIRSAELVYYAEHQTFLAVAKGNIENSPAAGENPGVGVTVTTNS